MTKDLREKAIKFKGKEYVLVADRVLYFNEEFENGCIQTELVSRPEDSRVIVKASVYPNMVEKPDLCFTGYSQASFDDKTSFVNKSSALENAETSAVGRALAFMGIGVIENIASADEIVKAQTNFINGVRQGIPQSIEEYQTIIEPFPTVVSEMQDAKRAHNRDEYAKKHPKKVETKDDF